MKLCKRRCIINIFFYGAVCFVLVEVRGWLPGDANPLRHLINISIGILSED